VSHTLVGAALAETGLKRRSALATATLLIGANLPDVDILAYADSSVTALWFRRGVTHGVLGWLLLPLLLTGVMLLWDRLFRKRGGRSPDAPVRPAQLLALAVLAVITHPLLDLLNVYGIRLLMPFSETWFYGDTLFIVDPWLWAILVAGIFLTRRRAARFGSGRRVARLTPALGAVLLVVVYIGTMAALNVAGRRVAERAIADAGLGRPVRLMVAPVPVNPLRRWVVFEFEDGYRFGTLRWLGRRRVELHDLLYTQYTGGYGAVAATRGPNARKFLSWARFPYFRVSETPGGRVVHIGDARYTLDPANSWASLTVPIGE
jgi:inner membrane protein